MSQPTASELYFGQPALPAGSADAYRAARGRIESTPDLLRALDGARTLMGITKAELADRIDAKPEFVRRLLTAKNSNPTADTLLKLARALGFHLQLVPNAPISTSPPARPAPFKLRGKKTSI